MKVRLALALAAVAVASSACAGDEDPSSTRTPGDPTTVWEPETPAEPVAEADVESSYDALLGDVTAAVDGQSPGLTWSASTLRTEEFEGSCAVTIERVADGSLPPRGDDTLDLGDIDAALTGAGFDRLATADDPGGALRWTALGEADALFELRSKDPTTTVAVRVPTTADSCAG